ncbi:MAG: hypothetical protein ABI789_01210 [Usitatibacter sp.]
MLTLLLAFPWGTGAVYLNADGMGQALIYPYYTTQATNGSAYNTLFSIVNHAADAKALRVRFREARNSRSVAEFNVFLGPHDAWTAGVIPTASGSRLVTHDTSCTAPRASASDGITFSSASYTGAASDGNGDGLDRTREGWIEVIEMATLVGGSATAVTHDNSFQGSRLPFDCSAVQVPEGPTLAIGAPTGGISGTITLINVANGMDFSMNAEALAELSKRSLYRIASDAYPDFNSAEIDPISIVVANGFIYRSAWNRPVDAVSATLMRKSWAGEFVVDQATRSNTDFVTTFPTRSFYTEPTQIPPFVAASGHCTPDIYSFAGEPVAMSVFNREERGGGTGGTSLPLPPVSNFRCAASTVFGLYLGTGALPTPLTKNSLVLGSDNQAFASGNLGSSGENGWLVLSSNSGLALTSRTESVRTDISSGNIVFGPHAFAGLPVVGFTVRTFQNGVLSCGSALCQGNYGGAFALKYTRAVGTP